MIADERVRRRLLVPTALAAGGIGASSLFAYAGADFHGNDRAMDQLAIGAAQVAVGTYVAWRRPKHPLGWLLLAAGVAVWMTFAASSWIDWLFSRPPANETLVKTILHGGIAGWIVFRGIVVAIVPTVVPDGWATRRGRLLAIAAAIATVVTAVAHSRLNTLESFMGEPPVGTAKLAEDILPWGHRAIWACAAVALVDLVVRTARMAPEVRRAYRWFVATTLVLLLPALDGLAGDAFGTGPLLHGASESIELWTSLALPLVLAVGIVRHGLLDIRVIVRRATTYAALALIAGAVYVAGVLVFAAITDDGLGAGPVVATGLVAVAVVPAYSWVQRGVDRAVFGNRGDPFEVVRTLGDRLAIAPGGDGLQLATDTLCEQLRLPYVAVELSVAGASVVTAASGAPTRDVERFAVRHRGRDLGSLAVGWRTETEPFRPAERELLATFAGQVGVIAHDAALAEALRRSRAVLLETREQERLRIRRDLHDGLGATLASVSLGIGTAAERLNGQDATLAGLLRDLETELGEAVADIRRLVHDLRPPALDELGLVDAVREHVAGLQSRSGDNGDARVEFEVTARAPAAPLPPAVELAAYRVALEAMTNVVRHSHARRCWVRIDHDETLDITVEDDGIGVADDAVAGVGLGSMRDRVVELGGSLGLRPRHPSGTSVIARFPLDLATPVP